MSSPQLLPGQKMVENSRGTPNFSTCFFAIHDFETGRPPGKRKFENVYLARKRKNRFHVTLKALFKSQVEKEGEEHQLCGEISSLPTSSDQIRSVAQSCPTLCTPTSCFSTISLTSEGSV